MVINETPLENQLPESKGSESYGLRGAIFRILDTKTANFLFVFSILTMAAAILIIFTVDGANKLESRLLQTSAINQHLPEFFKNVLIKYNLGIGIITAGLLFFVTLIEPIFTGWENSAVYLIFVRKSKSAWRDVFLYGIQMVGGMTYLTTIFTFGAAYITGIYVNAVTSAFLHMDLRVKTGFWYVDMTIYIIAFSFFEYWDHRILHTKSFWRLHRVHHSASDLNMFTSGRNHPALFAFEPLIRVWVPALIAAPPEYLLLFGVFHKLHQFITHSQVRWTWGWFGRWIVVSPRFHQVHHSVSPEHQDKNFTNFFTIWDHLFGTWCGDTKSKLVFGVNEDEKSPTHKPMTLLKEFIYDCDQWIRDLFRIK